MTDALDVARGLAAAGVPVFVAYPDPEGKTASGRATGYILPKSWQTTSANPAYVNAWEPGRALCAVMGHCLDLIDTDPRNGGDAEQLADVMPAIYAEAATPSGGRHFFVASMGAGSRDGVLPGIDIKAGDENGGSRGFAFIAPTVRVSKVTGERAAYQWVTPPDPARLRETGADRSGRRLAELIRQARRPSGSPGLFTQPDGLKHTGPIPYGEHHIQLLAYAGSLRARGIPPHEAGALMLRRLQDCVQPPGADRPRYTETETLDLLRDVYGRYPAGDPAAENAGQQAATQNRLKATAGNRNPVDIADDVAIHILAGNEPPRLFSMGSSAAVLKDGKLQPLDADGWLFYVARRVDFVVPTKDGTDRIVQPPPAAMKLIPSVVIPDLPALDAIAATPYLDAGGNVIGADGYHPATRLVLHTGGLRLPPISDTPGKEDVAQAVKLLTEDWLGDFPFAAPADRANALAVLLTLTGRMFFALAPLFVVDASTPGSGKGLLVSTISLIAAGTPPHLMELPSDGEEQRKKITSALLAGQDLITWDESHVITGRSLAMILTAEKYSDRLLGGNKMINVVNRFTQVALGNNVQVWGDMKRRVVPSRLVPDTSHPEHRTGFRHPDLEGWVRSNRGELLAAILTIWRNWIARGRPKADVTMGSFERWARTVGGALEAAGISGFLSGTSQWLDTSDEDASEWQEHLAALRRFYGSTQFAAMDVAALVGSREIGLPWFKRDADMPLAKALGYRYRNIRDRWLGDLRLVSPGVSNGRTRWQVQVKDSETVSTHLTISTENRGTPDIASRDGEIGRHPTGDLEPASLFRQPDRPGGSEWPPGSIGAEPRQ